MFFGLLTLFVVAKLVRAVWLAADGAEGGALAMAPLAALSDVWVALLSALAVAAVQRLPLTGRTAAAWRQGGYVVLALWMLGVALLQGANLSSYHLTGRGLDWARLRGDEGAGFGDLGLLEPGDLTLSILLMAGAVATTALGMWLGWRWRRRLRLPVVGWAGVALAGLALQPAFAQLPDPYALFEQPVLLLVPGFGDDAVATGPGVGLAEVDWDRLLKVELSAGDATPGAPEIDDHVDNAVLFLAEGVPWTQTSFGAPDADPTPNMRRRAATQGLLFDRFYATFHSSIQTLFAVGCSQFPPSATRAIPKIGNINPRVDCGELSEHFQRAGLEVGFFHGGQFAFYDKLSFFGGRAYAALEDASVMAAKGAKRPDGAPWWSNKWGIDDRAMVDEALAWIDALPKGQRFVLLMVPVAPHYPYKTARDIKTPFDRKGPKLERFRHAVHYQDQVFERLMAGLEARGLAGDTVVAWAADHGEVLGKPARRLPGSRQVYEDNLHVPLVLLNPRLFGDLSAEERVVSRVGSHVDLVPTFGQLLDVDPDPRHVGQPLLSDSYVSRRVFFGSNVRKGKYQIGFVDGRYKHIHVLPDGWDEVYDVVADPAEQDDLSERFAEAVARSAADARELREVLLGVEHWPHLTERSLRDKLAVGLRYRIGDDAPGTFPCHVGDPAAACEREDGAGVRLAQRRVRGGKRDCVLVSLPKGGDAVELRLTGDLLATTSGTRLGLPRGAEDAKDAKTRFAVRVDGREVSHGALVAGKKASLVELSFQAAQSEIRIEVAGDPIPHDEVCVVLADAAWWAPSDFGVGKL